MTKEKAKEILGDRAIWELRNMRKSLSMFGFMNTEEEDERLEAVNTLLKQNNEKN